MDKPGGGRGRGALRPKAVPAQEPKPASPVEEIAGQLENVAVQPPPAEFSGRPTGRGRAARGRTVVPHRPEPQAPGLPPSGISVASPNVYVEEEAAAAAAQQPVAPAPALASAPAAPATALQSVAPAPAIASAPAPAAPAPAPAPAQQAGPVEPQPEPAAAAAALPAEQPPAAPTVGGSESFTAVHMIQKMEPVVKRGEKGDKVPLCTNFIRIKLGENKGMFQYRVDFKPPTDARDLRKKALNACVDVIGTIRTFDGQTLFIPQALPRQITEVEIPHPNDPEEKMKVTFKFVKKQTMLENVQFYNVLLRKLQRTLGNIEMGRNYYDYRVTHLIAQHKLEIWPGTVTRIDEVEDGLMLCLDASHRVLRMDTVLDMWYAIRDSRPAPLHVQKERFREALAGKLVMTTYNKQCYRVDGITWDLGPDSEFERKGEKVTFREYYKQQYNITITDPNQPMLTSNPKERKNEMPGRVHVITLIPELCRMSGLSDEQKSNFTVMKDVAQFTRITPAQRIQALNKFIQNVKTQPAASQVLSEWGLEFEEALLEVEGRAIAPPAIEFNPNCTLRPAKADFSREATTTACYRPVALRRSVIFCTRNDKPKGDGMVRLYKQVCVQLGIGTGPPMEVITVGGNTPNDFRNALTEYARPETIQVVFVILPAARDDLYAAVKRFCVSERPIPSQVILSKTLNNEKRLRSVMQKVALQVNCKLGGALWCLKIPLPTKIMFVGIDVYHDPKRKDPSVTAFVASMDTSCTSYYSRALFQKPHQESLDSLVSIFVKSLEEFRDANGGQYPDRVIVYRDGVGDGQWDHVRATEVKMLTDAIEVLGEHKPMFTFIVVQKKINERFFALKGRSADNPTPGTVLDRSVNRRYHYDFFIVSQLVRQGTVSPTHFVVLEDNSDIKPDLIQKFSFAMTFMYYNWPGTIRVPAPCQYAHKLAYLLGQFVKAEPSAVHNNSLYYL